MLPEAFEQGGAIIGFATLIGFLTALVVKILKHKNRKSHGKIMPAREAWPALAKAGREETFDSGVLTYATSDLW